MNFSKNKTKQQQETQRKKKIGVAESEMTFLLTMNVEWHNELNAHGYGEAGVETLQFPTGAILSGKADFFQVLRLL